MTCEFKICIKCNENKEINCDNFIFYKDGQPHNVCKECQRKRTQNRRQRIKNGYKPKKIVIPKIDNVIDNITYRECTKCNDKKELNINNFYYRKKFESYTRECIECLKKHAKEYIALKKNNAIEVKHKEDRRIINHDGILYKKCTLCHETKELKEDNFGFKIDYNRFKNQCKKCIKEKNQDWRKSKLANKIKKEKIDKSITNINGVSFRKCSKCDEVKELNNANFHLRKTTNKFRKECKICAKKTNSNYLKKLKNGEVDKTSISIININDVLYKKCNKCQHIKELNNNNFIFKKNKQLWYYICKDCKRDVDRKYRKENGSKIYIRNKKRVKNNITIKYREFMSRLINDALKKRGLNKEGRSTFEILGYTPKDLVTHLQNLFESWMNWDNHGVYKFDEWNDSNQLTWKWQIDHIIPASKFKYNSLDHPDFKKCWALENLRPYSAKLNVIEGDRR